MYIECFIQKNLHVLIYLKNANTFRHCQKYLQFCKKYYNRNFFTNTYQL
jgi:hypothetical protein